MTVVGPRHLAHPLVERMLAPFHRFSRLEASGGIVLLVCTAVALAWANSPWAAAYHDAWTLPVGFAFGDRLYTTSTHVLVDDVLMSIFFLVVGLEIRRELHHGELSDPRRAALPAIAALGGMLVPAAISISSQRRFCPP